MELKAFSDRGSFTISAQKKGRVKAVKKKRNRLLATILALAMCFSFFPAAYAADGEVQSVTIGVYSTTDMHGKVYSENPVGGTISNSYLKVATAMAQERAAMDGTILIDNGDAIQGTTITSYNVNVEGGANNPVALCLRYCGYDVFVPGNHEFNYTMPVQENFYDMLAAPADGDLPGTPVTAVCANLLDTETGEVADPYVPYVIKEFKAGEKTFKIAVLGFENMNVPNWDVASHYEGMQFWSDGNTDRSYAWEWENKWQAELEAENCDIVIVAAHSGEGSTSSFNVESQLAYFVANTDGIDMVIAGHNHSVGTSTLQNKNGESVVCVNGGTSRLTKTPITLNSDGTFSFGESSLINLGDSSLANDAELSTLIKPTYDAAVEFVNEPIGTLSGEWDTVSGKTLYSVQGDITDLIHKAQIWAVEQGLARSADAEKYEGETIISITSPVASSGFTMAGLFGEGADTATISLKDCYSLYRYDNNLLYAIEMTGKQLRDWLDYCSNIYKVSGDTISGGGYGTDIAYGINYEVYLGEEEGSRVVNMTWPDGTPVADDDKFIVGLSSYRLAANADADEFGWYKTTGIDMSQAIWDGTVDAEFGAVGGSIPLIVGEYIKAMCKDGGTIAPGAETHWSINAGADTSDWDRIAVLETTDVHGYLMDTSSGNESTFQHRLAYIANEVDKARQDPENDAVILLDGGDIYQGTPVSNMTYGNAIRATYDKMGYDAVCLGNHEFDWAVTTYAAESDGTMPAYDLRVGDDDPDAVTGNSAIPVLASNLYYADDTTGGTSGERVNFTKDYVVLNKGGYKVAVVGYIPDYSSDIMAAKIAPYEIREDLEALSALCAQVKESESADVVIVLAHASPASIANAMDPDVVDLVCGGHSHSRSVGVSSTTGIAYIQGNCQGQGYATADILIDPATKAVMVEGPRYVNTTSNTSALYNTEENKANLNQEIVSIGNKSWDSVGDVMGEVLGYVDTDITRSTIAGSKLNSIAGNWMADLMNRATGSVIACTNGGGIRCDLTIPEGESTRAITVGDIYTISPFGNKVMSYALTGQEVADLMNYALTGSLSLRFSGCDVEYYVTGSGKDAEYHTTKVTLTDGTQVYPVAAGNEDKTYLVSTNEYVATSSGTPFIGKVNANAGQEPIDNESAIVALRTEGDANDNNLYVDTTGHFKEVAAPTEPTEPTEIMVMSTTDMHGKVWDTDVLTDASVNNSFLKVATAVDSIRAEYENTILIDNGDLFQGTTISTYNILSQNGVNNPMVLALRNVGYDALVLGNHEFNYSWEVMQSMYGQLKAEDDENGSSVDVLGANLYWRDGDNAGQNAFTPYITKTFQVDGQEFKVGIIGFENTDCDQFDVPANFGVGEDGTGGVTLTPPGNPTRDMAIEAEKYVTQLRKSEAEGGEGCDFVIIAYHSGMGSGNTEGDLVIGANTESQIARMVAGNTGIDLVIAGHDHQSYRTRTTPDKNGNQIPVINGGGGSLARAVVSVSYDAESDTFTTSVEDLGNQSLSKLENDAELKALIQPAATAAEGYVNAQYGTAIGTWDGSSSFRLGHNDTIDLVNRSQIWTARQNGVAMDVVATTDIVSNRYTVSAGPISLKDIYRIYRYDNYLYAIEMTGAQLKAWLEGVAAFYSAQVDGDEITYKVQSNFVTALFYGLDFQYDLAKPEGERVVNLKLSSTGEPITDSQTLIVGVNNYVIGQDPFVKAMGKDASSTEEKAEIIANAVWSSQAELGDEQGLVTQMVANFVKSETEGEAGGVMPAPSGWSLGYNVEVEEEEPDYRPPAVYGDSKITVGTDQVTVTLKKDLTSDQEARLVRENASKPIVITGDGLSITIPAGTLSSGADINAMIVDPDASGSVIQVTLKDGTTEILPFAVVKDGKVSYVANVEGTYRLFSNSKTFADVSSGYWAADAIDFVTSHEFFNGTGNGVFSPDALMTRAMLVTVLYRIDGEKTAASSGFADVPAGTWYTDAVNWAAETGIVTGTGAGFDPDGTITREQLCTILIRYMETAGLELEQVADTSGLTDLNTVSSWAGDSVDLCVKYGLISGKPGGLCDPQGTATRAEIAAVLARFVQAAV